MWPKDNAVAHQLQDEVGIGFPVFRLDHRRLSGRPWSCMENKQSRKDTATPHTYIKQLFHHVLLKSSREQWYLPGMVEVLGPWLVPVEAVVSEPTAGAKMKSMSPSVDETGKLNLMVAHRLNNTDV